MAFPDIIAKKRDRQELTTEEIGAVVTGFVSGAMTEGQMAALLMAIFLNGMSARETGDLTLAMMHSGDTLDLSGLPGVKVDKHSTGGVGDKTTLVVAPLVASLGVPVPKMSGRALGHTGGTIDKLECIPGLSTALSPEQFRRQLAGIGVAIASQTESMVPADKKMYALRDATATVESIPLIAASVMSKKLAAGADALVLDVKAGEGAFMVDVERARELARAMVAIGTLAGRRVVALVTAMDQPLGAAVGDALELAEAVATLGGRGPADFAELCETVAGHMLFLGGAAADPEAGRHRARAALTSGAGLAKLKQLVQAQGGDPAVLDDPGVLLRGAVRVAVKAAAAGPVTAIDARGIGFVLRDLKAAAGASKHQCGLLIGAKKGQAPQAGSVATLIGPAALQAELVAAADRLARTFTFGSQSVPPLPLLLDVIRP